MTGCEHTGPNLPNLDIVCPCLGGKLCMCRANCDCLEREVCKLKKRSFKVSRGNCDWLEREVCKLKKRSFKVSRGNYDWLVDEGM